MYFCLKLLNTNISSTKLRNDVSRRKNHSNSAEQSHVQHHGV